MRSSRRKSLLPSRREIRNRHLGFLQIKNSSKRKPPLERTMVGRQETSVAAGKLGADLEPLILFLTSPSIQSNGFGRVVWGTTVRRQSLRIRPRAKISLDHGYFMEHGVVGAIPRTTYQQLRIGRSNELTLSNLSDRVARGEWPSSLPICP